MSGRNVPVTVLGGYLGAGKTTRLNAVLRAPGAVRRTAVLVNDFGEINLDAQLVRAALVEISESSEAGAQQTPVFELTNGCVCCQIGDDLSGALEQVLALEPPIERLLIEASGVAQPERVVQVCRSWSALQTIETVVVVDAVRVRQLAVDKYVGKLVLAQLCQADQLVLSRSDQLDTSVLDEVVAWLRRRSAAPVSAELPTLAEVGRSAESSGRRSARETSRVEDAAHRPQHQSAHRATEDTAEFSVNADARFVRASLTLPVWALNGVALTEAQLRQWWADHPTGLERIKGQVPQQAGLWEIQGTPTGLEIEARSGGLERLLVVAIGSCEPDDVERERRVLQAWLETLVELA